MKDDIDKGPARGLTRRAFLQGGGLVAVAAFVPVGCGGSSDPAVVVPVMPDSPTGEPFLSESEMRNLRAVVDRLVPPDDGAIGGAEVGCADAIEALLSAFNVNPPRIYAGGPFSDRAGSSVNHFAQFVPLDDYEALAWRMRIEGSAGRPQYEMNGPVVGLQQIYREGLAALGEGFADQPAVAQDLALRGNDPAVQAMVNIAFPHCVQFMYGAPEYGGNRNLAGWKFCQFDGDVQPRGYTAQEVEEGPTGGIVNLPIDLPLIGLLPLATSESAQSMLAQSDGRFDKLSKQMQAILARASRG